MNSSRILKVFSATLEANQAKAFRYKLGTPNAQINGLLHSNNTELSISFQNQNELEIERLNSVLTDALELPPVKSIVSWQQELEDCGYITGTIRNLSQQTKSINLYILIEQ